MGGVVVAEVDSRKAARDDMAEGHLEVRW